ncbi:MAG: Asp-tRNA(Asn)/Glu-tRNA(Gln) amidotransferase subunit GatA [Vicinamibacterales bacterium]
MGDAVDTTARALARAIAAGDTSARDVCEAFLARITAEEPRIGAFTAVVRSRRWSAPPPSTRPPARASAPLAGVPVAIKDNMCTAGVPTTAASRILRGFVPPYSATVVERLERAGAVVIGKTNLDEFAMGSSTENSALGTTKNPCDVARTPGGSSGGSAAAVAACMAPVALGSDTGGSIRQPAAFCGLVGLKPSYGRVSRYGLLAFASSLDQIGPLTRTTEDAALVLQVIAGHDSHDATSSAEPVPDYMAALDRGVAGLRIGVPRAFVGEGVAADVQAAFAGALARWQAAGATVVDVTLPHARHAIPVYYLIATAEASSNLARYDGVRYGHRATLGRGDGLQAMYDRTRDEGFGAEVKRRIMLGTYVLSAGYYDAYYLKAQQVRTLLRRDYEEAFAACDVVAMPTTPTTAFRLGEKTDDPIQMYLSDVFTVSANLTGLPAISVPAGDGADGLPVGVQLTGRMFDEATLLAAGHALEAQA